MWQSILTSVREESKSPSLLPVYMIWCRTVNMETPQRRWYEISQSGVRDDTLQFTLVAVTKHTNNKAYEFTVPHETAVQNSCLQLQHLFTTLCWLFLCPRTHRLNSDNITVGGKIYPWHACCFEDFVCNFCCHIQHVGQSCLVNRNVNLHPQDHKTTQPDMHKVVGGTKPAAATIDLPATQETPSQKPLHVHYNVFVAGADKKVDTYLTTVTINGATLQMEIDAHTPLTVISQATIPKLWPDGKTLFTWRVVSQDHLQWGGAPGGGEGLTSDSMVCWKVPSAADTPKGNHVNWKRPLWVLIVV